MQNEERWFEATHYIKKAIELDDKNAEFWFAMGDAEYHLDNYVAAEAHYKKVIDLEPDNQDIWLEYSHLLMADSRADEALELIKKGMIFLPESADLIYRLACYYYSIGNIQESYSTLATALDKNVQLCHTVFEYSPAMENDRHILEIIDLYKNRI